MNNWFITNLKWACSTTMKKETVTCLRWFWGYFMKYEADYTMIICFACFLFASMNLFGGTKPKQRCRKAYTLIYISEWMYRFSVRSTAHIASDAIILIRYMNKCILPLSLSASYIYLHSCKLSVSELFKNNASLFSVEKKK